MPAVKKYTRINFQNYPSTSTPLNATNLNKMDKGIDDLDDEVVAVKNTIENMSFDADAISYDNTQSGLQATDVQGAVDEINDNLSGFKFYPTGTELVAYIEGHGWYKDADGKYVIWGTATANALVEASPNTYYGRQSEEDLRGEVGADTGIPFSKGDISFIDGVYDYQRSLSKNWTISKKGVAYLIKSVAYIRFTLKINDIPYTNAPNYEFKDAVYPDRYKASVYKFEVEEGDVVSASLSWQVGYDENCALILIVI